MALLTMDSFDMLTSGLLTRFSFISVGVGINTTNGRRSTQSLRSDGGSTRLATRSLGVNAATVVCGFAIKISSGISSGGYLFGFGDSGTPQMNLYLNANGTVSVRRGTTNLATSTDMISSAGVYQYLEFKVVHSATGSYEVRLNGANILSASGVDTTNTANNYANQISFFNQTGQGTGGFSAGGAIDIDDLYVVDGTGSANNDFLGDRRVDCYFPNGNGNSSQLSGSDGNSTDNYLLVDEATPNDDTDYVHSSTSGQKDTYSFPNMSHTPSAINGIQINMYAKRDDAGLRSICSVTRSGGADTDGSARALSSGYLLLSQISEADPDTTAAWTQSGFDAAEFGSKVAA